MAKATRAHSTPQRTKRLRKIAAAPKCNAARQDSELLKLGCQLDLLVQRYQCARQRFVPVNQVHTKMLDQWRQANPGYSEAQLAEAYADIYKQLSEAVGGEHPDDVLDESDNISRAIMAIPATTVRGLAVKARLAAFGAEEYWYDNDEDADWGVLTLRKLVDAVIQVAASA
jgi:hypothetical protein